jgi:hypothetical protein
MPGDPKECREHAARCAELAVEAGTPQLRALFLELSKNWEKIAIQLEDDFAKLAENEVIGASVRESLDEARRLSNLPIRKQ